MALTHWAKDNKILIVWITAQYPTNPISIQKQADVFSNWWKVLVCPDKPLCQSPQLTLLPEIKLKQSNRQRQTYTNDNSLDDYFLG